MTNIAYHDLAIKKHEFRRQYHVYLMHFSFVETIEI